MSGRVIALVSNPASRAARTAEVRDLVARRLRDAGLRCRLLAGRDPEETTGLVRLAVDQGCSAVVVLGGDGTVNAAVQALAGTGVPLGVVPWGSGEDVARALGVPRRDPAAAADRVVAGRTRRIDLARAGGRWFVTVLAAGFDAVVNERANDLSWPGGRGRYVVAAASELGAFRARDYTVELDGVVRRLRATLVAVGNGPSFGGGLRIAEGAVLDDGLLDVVVVGPMTRRSLVRTFPRLWTGTHTGHPAYERHRVRTVTLAAPGIVAHADGERFGPLPTTIECVPGALEVLA